MGVFAAYRYYLSPDKGKNKVVQLFFDEVDIEVIPEWLRGVSYYCVNDEAQYQLLLRFLTGQPLSTKLPKGDVPAFKPVVDLAAMPNTSSDIVGREEEVA